MNKPLVARFLSIIALLIGASMALSIPWAWPVMSGTPSFERQALRGLLLSMALCLATAAGLWLIGRRGSGQVFRKEAMAIVGLSWILATLLGALPYLFSGTLREATRDAQGNILSSVPVGLVDALFEAQSGFSTTGATVLTDVEDPRLVPRCILFWRSMTHFLGGLGIIVLFVALLGQGSAGKAMLWAEMPGPSKESHTARVQHMALLLMMVYGSLNAVLTLLLMLQGLTPFDAICHAFGAMSTGGFSTHNASVGYYATTPGYNEVLLEATLLVFMILGATNFTLLFFLAIGQPRKLLADTEWRVFIGLIVVVTALVAGFGLVHGDFNAPGAEADNASGSTAATVGRAIRHSAFQVVSIITTTGFGTHDFDRWNNVGRGMMLLIMFVGGCAGSTGGGMKVIRHILFFKILKLEIERSYHPTVVRPLRLAGNALPQELRLNILVYFGLILLIFVSSWMVVVIFEPDATWTAQGRPIQDKLIDSATSIAAMLNNVGPGLGTVGPMQNYAHFSPASKLLFTWLMMVGRLEVFSILVLFLPGFWRDR